MVVSKANPIGIDWYIAALQTEIHDRLIEKWKLQDTLYKSYPRCYKNKTDNGYIAETYIGGVNYQEVYYDPSIAVSSFFGITGNTKRSGALATADVHLVFFADLKKIKPDIEHRADEEVRQDVTSLFALSLCEFSMLSCETGIENVLRDYPGSRRDERLKYIDMHPVHCFRINLKLIYNPNKIC
jgi:hypothetical protein